MKVGAWILIALWGILLAEPLLANFDVKSPYSECIKPGPQKSSCSKKSTCSKEESKDEEKDCEKNQCNPLLGCPAGNFYLVGQQLLHIDPPVSVKKKAILINDNRIVKNLSECWHPPEII